MALTEVVLDEATAILVAPAAVVDPVDVPLYHWFTTGAMLVDPQYVNSKM